MASNRSGTEVCPMTTLKEHIAFLQTLRIPFKGTLIEYLKHVIYEHYAEIDHKEIINDSTETMPFQDFVKACLQYPEDRVKSADTPAPLPPVQKANETG